MGDDDDANKITDTQQQRERERERHEVFVTGVSENGEREESGQSLHDELQLLQKFLMP